MGEQSSNSSIQIQLNEEDGSDDLISVRPSPSPSPSKSLSSQSPLFAAETDDEQVIDNKDNCSDGSNDSMDSNDTDDSDNNDKDDNEKETDSLNTLNTLNMNEREESISMSQCRYCYSDISKQKSVSQCHCSGVLCQSCLINELKLCHGRNSLLQCTVCKV